MENTFNKSEISSVRPKQKSRIKVLYFRSLINAIKLSMLMALLINLISPVFAQSSGYYEIREYGRPPSAFSLCCCSKQKEDEYQSIYSCSYREEDKCPENTKQYKLSIYDCPSNVIITKSKGTEEKQEGE